MPRSRAVPAAVLCGWLLCVVTLAGCDTTTRLCETNCLPPSIVDALPADPNGLLVGQATGPVAALVMNTLWAPLIYADHTGRPQPGLLAALPTRANGGYSADLKTITLRLRPGLVWSDGQPLTARDVVYTIALLQNPAYGARTDPAFSEIASATAPDARTVMLRLDRADAAFLAHALTDVLAFAPLPQHVYGALAPGDIATAPAALLPPVSSGPFRLAEWIAGDSLRVVRNERYYQAPRPYLGEIWFKIVPDQQTRLAMLQAGALQIVAFISPDQLDTLGAMTPSISSPTSLPGAVETLVFNLASSTGGALADLAVRQAIQLGIDRGALIKQIWHGLAKPTCDDAPSTFAHLSDGGACAASDPTAAAALLDQAGWALGADGYRAKDGHRLALRYATAPSSTPGAPLAAPLIQQQLRLIGIQVDVTTYAAAEFYREVLPGGAFDLAEYAIAPAGGDPADNRQWDCDQSPEAGGFNVMRWCDAAATQADHDALATLDQAARARDYATLYSAIAHEVPAVFLYAAPTIAAARWSLHSVTLGPFGPTQTVECWNWYESTE